MAGRMMLHKRKLSLDHCSEPTTLAILLHTSALYTWKPVHRVKQGLGISRLTRITKWQMPAQQVRLYRGRVSSELIIGAHRAALEGYLRGLHRLMRSGWCNLSLPKARNMQASSIIKRTCQRQYLRSLTAESKFTSIMNKKRPHKKSRFGCSRCKSHRIKVRLMMKFLNQWFVSLTYH